MIKQKTGRSPNEQTFMVQLQFDPRVESYANFSEENFQVLASQALPCRISNLLQAFATCFTRFSVHSSERQVVITGFEVVSLLFGQLCGKPRYNG